MKRLFVIDNYDSFTYNLVQLFSVFDLDITVHRCDRITVADIEQAAPDYILISPGPKTPQFAGISTAVVAALAGKIPILGVCLGMQCMNEAFGGQTVRAPLPMHGKTSHAHHSGATLFQGIPSPFTAARYHSLIIQNNDSPLQFSATADDEVVMGLYHPEWPVFGVQFHPESFLTEYGHRLAENFLSAG